MQPSTNQDYKQLLTEVIKKQIVILGPDITLSKARNVKGLTVADDGTVTAVEGNSQEVTQALIDQFVQLSGLIVKKTMEPLLSLSQEAPIVSPTQVPQIPTAPVIQPAAPTPAEPTPAPQPVPTPTQPTPVAPQEQAPVATPTQPVAQPPAQPATAAPTAAPAANPQTSTNPAPASNPLAA